jgi:hypothetical protein
MTEKTQSAGDAQKVFAEEYAQLCDKHGLLIVGVPRWVATNHGSYEMVIDLIVQSKQ